MFAIALIVGFFAGATVLSTLFDIAFFDVPLTLKLSKVRCVKTSSALAGSGVSIMLWMLIFIAICFLIYRYMETEIVLFIIVTLISCIWAVVRKKKERLAELYFEKHSRNIAPTLQIVLYDRNGFDYEGVKRYLNLFLRYHGKEIK